MAGPPPHIPSFAEQALLVRTLSSPTFSCIMLLRIGSYQILVAAKNSCLIMRLVNNLSFLWASLVAQWIKNLPALQRCRFNSWVGRYPENKMATHCDIFA